MGFPEYRGRRSRKKGALRRMLAETQLTPADLIYPVYVTEGRGVREESRTLPGVFRYSPDRLGDLARELLGLGVGAVLVQGIGCKRDELAREAVRADSVICRALKELRTAAPELVTVTDIGVAAYTSQGHGGVLKKGEVDNDATLELLAEMAVLHGRAGADFISPSSSMDGQVGFLRETLDEEDLDQVGIVACSVSYRSSYAADPTAEGGSEIDVSSYQTDPANVREALREVELDIEEGADMVGIKPALAYLDVLRRIYEEVTLPVVGFSGCGEYQLVKAAEEKGWFDSKRAMLENLLSIKRAGAECIVTLHALEAARALAS